MNIYLSIILISIVAYLLGSISSAVILSKLLFGKDIRSEGSGNAGATNMLRTHGVKMGVCTLVFDLLKGIIAVFLGKIIMGYTNSHYLITALPLFAGLFAVLGHNYPVYFGFKGGKGVATSLGVILAINWKVALLVAIIALLIMATTKYVSLGSVTAAVLFFIFDLSYMVTSHTFYMPELIFAGVISALLIIRHSQNIKRLLAGTENKLGQKKA